MTNRTIKIMITSITLALFTFLVPWCFGGGGWDNTKPADTSVWNNAAGEIRANNDALEAALGVDLANAGALTVFNVKNPSYGATGDGTTNDRAAIELADVAAAAAGGGIVFFPAGTYLVEGSDSGNFRLGVTITADNVIFMGVGEASIILQDDNEPQYCFNDNGNTDPVTNVRFTQLKFVGNTLDDSSSGTGSPFKFYLFDGVEIDHCYFEDFSRIGGFYGGLGIVTVSEGLRFHHNEVYGGDATVSLVGIKCQFAKDMWITDNEWRKIARPLAIEIDSSSIYTITSVWFSRNKITECTVSTASSTNTYLGCQITATDGGNIVNNIHITDNIFESNSRGTATGASGEIAIIGRSSLDWTTPTVYSLRDHVTKSDINYKCTEAHTSGTFATDLAAGKWVIAPETMRGVVVSNNTFRDYNTDNANDTCILVVDAHRVNVIGNILYAPNAASTAHQAIRVRNSSTDINVIGNIVDDDNNGGWGNSIKEDQVTAKEMNNNFIGNITNVTASFANIADTKSKIVNTSASGTYRFDIAGGDFQIEAGGVSDLNFEVTTIANDATPTVNQINMGISGGTTTITDFDDGETGQTLIYLAEHSQTITDGTNILLRGSQNFDMATGDSLLMVQKADGKWYEIARMVDVGQTYAVSNVTTDRAYNADSTSDAEVADVLGTLIDDLRSRGLVK